MLNNFNSPEFWESQQPLHDDDDFVPDTQKKSKFPDNENESDDFDSANSKNSEECHEQVFLDYTDPIHDDDDVDYERTPKPDVSEDDELVADDELAGISQIIDERCAEKSVQTLPKAQTGPVVYDEYETAQLIMKKFSFAYSSERLYVFTGPGYECLDKNELIALMKDSVPYELRRKKPSFWSSVVKNIEQESKIHISLDEIEHPKDEIVFKNGCFNVITKKNARSNT